MIRPLLVAFALAVAAVSSRGYSQETAAASPTADQPLTEAQKAVAAAASSIAFQTLADAQKSALGRKLFVRAQVVSVMPPREGSNAPYTVYLTDAAGGSAKLVILPNDWGRLAQKDAVLAGANVEVYVLTSEYKGERQLELVNHRGIRVQPGTVAPVATPVIGPQVVKAADIALSMLGKSIIVQGKVAGVEPPRNDRAPWKLFVEDPSGRVLVVYWKDAANAIPAQHKPEVGREVQVTGVLAEYRGALQVRMDSGTGIKLKPTDS